MFALQITLVALVLTRATAALGPRLRLVDIPDARKQHCGSVPVTGGIAIFLTMLVAVFVRFDLKPLHLQCHKEGS